MVDPLKLVIVNDFGHVNGGTAQVAIADAIALAKAGHEVCYYCAVPPVAPELLAGGVRVVCLDQQEIALDTDRLRAAKQGVWNTRAARVLEELLLDYPVSPIVHIHGWTKALSGSVCAAAAKRHAPIVVSLHDYFAACPNGGFYQYRQQRICELKPMSKACIACNCDPRTYSQKLYRVVRQGIQQNFGGLPGAVRHFIYASELTKRILRPYLPADAEMHFVPNAVECRVDGKVSVKDNQDFVMAGRLSPEKGVLLFAEASKRAGIRPIFAGEGRMRDAILAVNPEAEITGWLSREALSARLSGARALVCPSLGYETFGLTVAEAIALGLPTVVSKYTAASELIEDGVTGLLFRTGDAQALAEAICRLKDPNFASTLGSAAYLQYWKNPLTLERHLGNLTQAYRSIMAN